MTATETKDGTGVGGLPKLGWKPNRTISNNTRPRGRSSDNPSGEQSRSGEEAIARTVTDTQLLRGS